LAGSPLLKKGLGVVEAIAGANRRFPVHETFIGQLLGESEELSAKPARILASGEDGRDLSISLAWIARAR